MADKLERRYIPVAQAGLALRSDDGEVRHITGHAAVFSQWARIWDFDEIILPGAFDDVLDQDVRMLINHDPWPVLGRSTKDTLALEQDEVGLAIDGIPPNSPAGQNAIVALERGDVDQMSFAFRVGEHGQRWEWNEDEQIWKRYITKYSELADVSIVTYPAYEGTDAQVRAAGYRAKPPQARGEDGGENDQKVRIAQLNRRRALALIERDL